MRRRTTAMLLCLLPAAACALASPALAQVVPSTTPSAQNPATQELKYKGVAQIPGIALDFTVSFQPFEDGDGWVASLTIPMQGLDGAPLEDVAITDETITFKLGAPANAVFSGKFLDDQRNKVEGTIAQAGAEFPFTMERMAPGEKTGPARPQMPEPPFPYETRDVTFENIEAGVTLAGTLSIPEGEGPHPAVIFITGSGPQDRDETLLGHKPFLVIADHLARNGVASLRYDDRGFGESSGDFATATTLSFVADARAALAYLETVPEIDPDRRGIIGHSEGGLAAPFVARNNDDVDFIVLLAGTALPGFDIVLTQSALIQRASGVPEETVELAAAQQREVFEFILQSDLRGEELREALIAKIEGMIGDQMPDETERRTIA
ncbi:MAG: alpha/beta fold hydrolase, partial [Planctomycetota bacterium]|nr:alpha/beta fold hydrolase [Planctomycetota bacterium]